MPRRRQTRAHTSAVLSRGGIGPGVWSRLLKEADKRIILLLSALTIALAACESPPLSARSPNGAHAVGSSSGGFFLGESSGSGGDLCVPTEPSLGCIR
jgi:hypothetical protein